MDKLGKSNSLNMDQSNSLFNSICISNFDFEFVDKCREIGINVPIIPGLKPLTTKKQLSILPSIFHIDLPDELVEAVENCKSNDDVKKVGVEWAVEQCRELKKANVPCLHFYSMGKSEHITSIAKEVF